MKPRANLGNRTRQPKGCANRIAKPARLGRTSQNHLMMIVLNKTGATTVAQPKTTGIQQCNNAKTAPFQRFLDTVTAIQNLLPAAFGVSTREPAALLFAPGGHSPTGGVCCMVQRWNVCAIVFWRVVWYRAGTFLYMRSRPRRGCGCVVPVVAVAVAVVPWTLWPWLWRPPSLCRRAAVATRRRMLVFAMVLVWSALSWFALCTECMYSESHQANDNERNGDGREATTTETSTARPVTRSPLTGAAWMINN